MAARRRAQCTQASARTRLSNRSASSQSRRLPPATRSRRMLTYADVCRLPPATQPPCLFSIVSIRQHTRAAASRYPSVMCVHLRGSLLRAQCRRRHVQPACHADAGLSRALCAAYRDDRRWAGSGTRVYAMLCLGTELKHGIRPTKAAMAYAAHVACDA
jgi:hypothetical protein